MTKYYLAIDIGASSGRHILGHVQDGRIVLEEIHRFDNRQLRRNGHDCWDMIHLWNGILEGLNACKRLGKIPETMIQALKNACAGTGQPVPQNVGELMQCVYQSLAQVRRHCETANRPCIPALLAGRRRARL